MYSLSSWVYQALPSCLHQPADFGEFLADNLAAQKNSHQGMESENNLLTLNAGLRKRREQESGPERE